LTLERYLGMSVTTKSHMVEDHSIQQQFVFDRIGDLGEDLEREITKTRQKRIDDSDVSEILQYGRQ
jgi:hypothetical protein